MNNKAFIVWNPFQRRAQTLADEFDLDLKYFHYKWEENGKLFKLLSYFKKSLFTLIYLIKAKPDFVFIQLAPTILLYVVSFYCLFARCKYVSDCHNTMIYDDHWIKWPFAKLLLARSHVLIVHNEDVQYQAKKLELNSIILRDPLPKISIEDGINEIAGLRVNESKYIIIPGSMAPDEPIKELFQAIASLPNITFVFTWFKDKLPAEFREDMPNNIVFSGFLPEDQFNVLFANASAAIVLTTREGTQPSGASEAIALGVPLVLSEIQTTRKIYGDAPIFVDNNTESIAKGIVKAIEDNVEAAESVKTLRNELTNTTAKQIEAIKFKIR